MWILNIVVWPKQSKRWNTYKIKTPGPTVCPRWAINSSLLLLLASIIVGIWAFIGQKDQPDAYKLKITILLFWNKQKQNINPINPLLGRIERQKTTKRHKNKSQTKTPNKQQTINMRWQNSWTNMIFKKFPWDKFFIIWVTWNLAPGAFLIRHALYNIHMNSNQAHLLYIIVSLFHKTLCDKLFAMGSRRGKIPGSSKFHVTPLHNPSLLTLHCAVMH